MSTTFENATTKSVDVNGTSFVLREVGKKGGIPVMLLHHLTAVLDDWDPRVVDGLAAQHHVIAFDNRGVGGSGGSTPKTVEEQAPPTSIRSIFCSLHRRATARYQPTASCSA